MTRHALRSIEPRRPRHRGLGRGRRRPRSPLDARARRADERRGRDRSRRGRARPRAAIAGGDRRDRRAARAAAGGSSTSARARRAGSRALDAAECEATFVVAAGPGRRARRRVAGRRAAERRRRRRTTRTPARRDVAALGVAGRDAVVGVSASGRTPYALGALDGRARAGALTVAVVSRRRLGARGASPSTRSSSSSGPR